MRTSENCCRSHGFSPQHSTCTAPPGSHPIACPQPHWLPQGLFYISDHVSQFSASFLNVSSLQSSPGMSRKQDKPLPAPPPPQRDPPPPPPPERPPHMSQEGRAAWLATPSSGLPRDPRAPSEAWSPKDTTPVSDSRAVAADRSPKLAHAAPAHINGRPLSCSGADLGVNRNSHRFNNQSECSKVRVYYFFNLPLLLVTLDVWPKTYTGDLGYHGLWNAQKFSLECSSLISNLVYQIREKCLDVVLLNHLEPSVPIHLFWAINIHFFCSWLLLSNSDGVHREIWLRSACHGPGINFALDFKNTSCASHDDSRTPPHRYVFLNISGLMH